MSRRSRRVGATAVGAVLLAGFLLLAGDDLAYRGDVMVTRDSRLPSWVSHEDRVYERAQAGACESRADVEREHGRLERATSVWVMIGDDLPVLTPPGDLPLSVYAARSAGCLVAFGLLGGP